MTVGELKQQLSEIDNETLVFVHTWTREQVITCTLENMHLVGDDTGRPDNLELVAFELGFAASTKPQG